MTKKKSLKSFKTITLIAIFATIAYLSWVFTTNSSQQTTSINTSDSKEEKQEVYTPDYPNWELNLALPINTKVQEEKAHSITLSSDNQGTIMILQNATNHTNLISHLSDPRNDILSRQDSIEQITINDFEAVIGQEQDKKNYFIYANNVVYSFSTSHEDLYDELDQIANSFQYIPEN